MTREFLVCYDYGQGGVWALLVADSPAQIATLYPQLEVFDAPPAWMSAEHLAEIRANMKVEIEAGDHPFLRAMPAQPT